MVKCVLSIDGGGVRGISSVVFLSNLEKAIDRSLIDVFDLMVGSSVGGLIIGDLVYGGKSATEIALEKFSKHNLEHLFPRSARNIALGPIQMIPMYNGETKRDFIARDIPPTCKFIQNENIPKMAVPVYDVKTGKGSIQRNWIYNPYTSAPLVLDVLDQTSSAPGYFPIVTTTSSGIRQRYADGSIFASNPADFAFVEAINLWPNEKIRVLSIGTGYAENANPSPNDYIGGIQWVVENKLLDAVYESQKSIVDYVIEGLAKAHPDRYTYLRIDGLMEPLPALDCTDSVENLKRTGDVWWDIYKEKTIGLITDNMKESISSSQSS